MLGIKQNNTPIKGEDAERVRQAAMRLALRKPNEAEVESIKRLEEVRRKFTVIWNTNKSRHGMLMMS